MKGIYIKRVVLQSSKILGMKMKKDFGPNKLKIKTYPPKRAIIKKEKNI